MASAGDLGRQIRWMMSLRVIIVTCLFLPTSVLFYQELAGPAVLPVFGIDVTLLAWIMGVTYGLTLAYVIALRFVTDARRFALLQICADIALETAIVYYSGTVTTPFLVLYLVSIIAASILLEQRESLGVAAFAVLSYLTLLNLIYWGVLPLRSSIWDDVASIPITEVFYYVFVSLAGFLSTSLLVSFMAERNRRARQALQAVGYELTELQRFNERVIDNISGGLLVLTPDGRVSVQNAPGSNITGYSLDELRNRPLSTVLPGGEALFAEARRVLASRKVHRFEADLTARNGVTIPVGASLTSLPGSGAAGEADIVGYVLIFQDLTELRKLEAQVRLKEKLAAVGELAAGIAHEIRNPLASMSGSVQLLRSELRLSGDQRRLMDIVVDESRRLSRIIQDFLTFARPPQPKLESVDVRELLEQTVLLLRNSAEMRPEHDIEVECSAGGCTVVVDAGQIKQVFWNLALNAVHAMPKGGELRIRLDLTAADAVTVAFIDNGVGITAERMASLFTPFASGSSRRSGLGLSIVYGILREHEGDIDVKSTPAGGTTVTIQIPRQPRRAAEGAVQP